MTNAELITALRQLPPEAEAKVYVAWEDFSIGIESVDGESLRSDCYPVWISNWDGAYSVLDVQYPYVRMTEKKFESKEKAVEWVEENGFMIGRTNGGLT